jgi:hypothetical protein
MKYIIAFLIITLNTTIIKSQVLGKTTTEDYTAGFEKEGSVYNIPEYNGKPVPVAIINHWYK